VIIINNNINEKEKNIKKTIDKIDYLKRMIYYTNINLNKLYYEELLSIEERNIEKLNNEINCNEVLEKSLFINEDDLNKYNGKDGNPAYVAVRGLIYDVTDVPIWKGGVHFAGLEAGQDLTKYYMECHALKRVLEKYKPIGILVK
jgi:predicted heme/steroid binding protein